MKINYVGNFDNSNCKTLPFRVIRCIYDWLRSQISCLERFLLI